jgi:hypothetical protein
MQQLFGFFFGFFFRFFFRSGHRLAAHEATDHQVR